MSKIYRRFLEVYFFLIDYQKMLRLTTQFSLNGRFKRLLILYMVYEVTSRKRLKLFQGFEDSLSNDDQLAIGRQFSQSLGFMVFLFYDDGIDQFNLSKAEIVNHYSRCLFAFCIGLWQQFPIDKSNVKSLAILLEEAIAQSIKYFPQTYQENEYLWIQHPFYKENEQIEIFDIEKIYFEKRSNAAADFLNVNILGSFRLGRALRKIRQFLNPRLLTQNEISDYEFNLLRLLTIVCIAQVQTIKQRNIDEIDWKNYMEIACGKSTNLIDCLALIRHPLQSNLYVARRLAGVRFCEQFYMDDIADFYEDTKEGILGVLHVRLLMQGRIAKILLSNWHTSEEEKLDLLDRIAQESQVWSTHFKGIFLQTNPYYLKYEKKDPRYTTSSQIELMLYYLLVNKQEDTIKPIDLLLSQASERYDKFVAAWKINNHQNCTKIILDAGLVEYKVDSFLHYMRENRTEYIETYSKSIYRYHLFRMKWLKFVAMIQRLFYR